MKIGKIFGAVVLTFFVGLTRLGTAAAAPIRGTAIFVDNSSYVTAYPTGSGGDLSPIALTTDMINPGGIARDEFGRSFVTNTPTNTITVYAPNATGNVPPLEVIGGPHTQLASPTSIALDASGNIYVLNIGTSSIAVYAPIYILNGTSSTANYAPLSSNTGIFDEAPTMTIRGPKTHLDVPIALALDSSGNIYVANQSGGPKRPLKASAPGTITIYPAGSTGNIAPSAVIRGANTGLTNPVSIAVDSNRAIYVGNSHRYVNSKFSYSASIEVFAAGSSDDARPTAVITGSNTNFDYPRGIAVDSAGDLYAAGFSIITTKSGPSYFNAINVYPSGSNGNISPATVIAGPDTGLAPNGIALDSENNLYVLNEFGVPISVTAYASGSSGDAAPTATITSAFNGISYYSSGIAVDASGKIYVTDSPTNSIAMYAAGSYGVSPPIGTIVGTDTLLSFPIAIGLDGAGNIVVLNAGGIITEYEAGSIGDAAPTVFFEVGHGGNPVAIAVGPRGAIYVASQHGEHCNNRGCSPVGSDNIAVYFPRGAGNSKPAAVISGSDTGLSSPAGMALDASGNIYVTNLPSKCGGFLTGPTFGTEECSGSGRITVYASGSNGNVKPAAEISGANTRLGSPSGITVDRNGNIYVLNSSTQAVVGVSVRIIHGVVVLPGFLANGPPPLGGADFTSILIFGPGGKGDISPSAIIGGPFTGLGGSAIAIGPIGQ